MYNNDLIISFLDQLKTLFPAIYDMYSQEIQLMQSSGPDPLRFMMLYQIIQPHMRELNDAAKRAEKLSAKWKHLVTSPEYKNAVEQLNKYGSLYKQMICRNTNDVLSYHSIANHMTTERFCYLDCPKDTCFEKIDYHDSDTLVLGSAHIEAFPEYDAVFLHYVKV